MKSKTSIRPKQETLEVKIEKIVPNGFGLGFADGSTVFVSLAAKGDTVRVRVREKKGKTVFAEIVEIIEPSVSRTAPECPYFGRCGGCDFQHLNYKAQLEAKVSIIRDCLTRIGKINFEREIAIIGSPREYNYRARAQWHADTRRQIIGYFKRNSHQIIDVETCPILTEELQNTLTGLRQNLDWNAFWAETIEIEAANSAEQVSLYSEEIIEPTQEIAFVAKGETFFYDAQSFFQGNPFLIEQLIETAVGNAAGETALDLYCGVGLFALPLARRFKKVSGVEASEKSIGFARKNAERAQIANAEFFAQGVSEWLLENDLKNTDFVLLDPPRSGTERETIEKLLQIRPKQISYVSCDPATLARDLRLLNEAYEIESITAIDLFPQNHHIETVVRLNIRANF